MLKSAVSQRENTIIKLPGLVDVHVHLREPGATQKEDFATGTMAAVAGGYTQILDMPNNTPATVSQKSLEEKEKLATGKIWCDLGFNFGATADSSKDFKKVAKKVFGLKIYMSNTTGPLIVESEKAKEKIFEAWPGPLPIMIHAEDKVIEDAIKLAKKYKKAIHICHVTANQLQAIKKAKKDGVEVTCEVTPHHLFLNKDDARRLGSLGIMKPPLLTKSDQQKLWDNLDKIDMISTDHAPHTLEEKKQNPTPFGVPGLETTLPLMLTAVALGKTSTARLCEMLATNPKKIFKLPEQKDTYVLVDFAKTYKISDKNL
ncbi:MAG: amidohydrolase family protein, partial [Candidatus Curtissbacteria bacterium]|nr:amidohydrolase family protein [Candidatus Curtissbacteria bacterium]